MVESSHSQKLREAM